MDCDNLYSINEQSINEWTKVKIDITHIKSHIIKFSLRKLVDLLIGKFLLKA